MISRRLTLATLLAVAVPLGSQAQDVADHPRVHEALHLLDVWVDAQRAYEAIPGVSIAAVHDQRTIWSRGFGHANRERRTPATPQTIYSICSISKLFTSIGMMQLRDRRVLRLDDPVGKHLAWFDRLRDRYPDAPPVTIEGLLTHASGLPRESAHPYWTGPDFPFPTHDEIVEGLREQEELYPAYEYFQYSNLGLTLAGDIIAAASGRPYGEYIRANILSPLGMTATTPEIPGAEHGRRMAKGYAARTRDGTRPEVRAFQARGIAPAAGFASTVEDLATFASWQFRVLHHGASEVLGRNTLREMYRIHWVDPDWETRWGLGFATWRENDKTYLGHGGSCPGYRSQLSIQPDTKVAVAVMTNASGVNAGLFARRAQQLLGPAIAAALDTTASPEPADTSLARYTGTYDESPWWGEAAVLVWKGQLAVLSLPTDDPQDGLMRLEKTGEHTFRRIRSNDELGEEVRFEVAPDGRVVRMWHNNNYSPKRP